VYVFSSSAPDAMRDPRFDGSTTYYDYYDYILTVAFCRPSREAPPRRSGASLGPAGLTRSTELSS